MTGPPAARGAGDEPAATAAGRGGGGGEARRAAAAGTGRGGDQHVFDRGGAVVFGGEGQRMIDVIGELRLVLLRLAEAVERVRRWTSCGCRRSTKPLSAI